MLGNCISRSLILSNDYDIIHILKEILKNKNIAVDVSQNIDDISCEYCLVIIGPDMDLQKVYQKIKNLSGIPPHFLFLENGSSCLNSYLSCKCKKVSLPMEIFSIEEYIEELLELYI
jgi:hypothetical protein